MHSYFSDIAFEINIDIHLIFYKVLLFNTTNLLIILMFKFKKCVIMLEVYFSLGQF